MSIRRVLVAVLIVVAAVLVTPAALVPGVNAADLIVLVAPLALVWVCPVRHRPPAGGASSPTDAD